jgi:hypothetical protein
MAMNVDKVAVLNVSPEELQRFSKADNAAPEGWQALVGDDGVSFFGRAIADGLLIMPKTTFESSEQFVRLLQGLFGKTFDSHADARGIFVLAAGLFEGRRYEEVTATNDGEWIPRAVEQEPSTSSGWGFADAARMFATPGTRERADAANREAPKEEDPLEAAGGKFSAIFAAKNERGALRRTLGAALDHSLDSSLLGSIADEAKEAEGEESASPIAEVIRRGVSSDPKSMNALEASLREAIDGGLKDDSEKNPAPEASEAES